MAKFTKAAFLEMLQERADGYQKKHKFDPRNGWAQVEGKETSVIVDYGRYDEICEIMSDLTEF